MPREQLAINTFERGMVSSADSMDIQKNVCYWCRDIDIVDRPGQLIGRPGDEDKSSSIGAVGNAQGHAFINKSDGKRTLVFYDATATAAVRHIEDFYGTPGAVTSLEAPGAFYSLDMILRNESIRACGLLTSGNKQTTPRWYGYTNNSVFGSSSSSLLAYNQKCSGDYTAATNGHFYVKRVYGNTLADGFFGQEKKYYYKIAIEYDGYQISIIESNSYTLSDVSTDGNYFYTTAGGYSDFKIIIRAVGGATSASSFNKRVTAILLFRAEGAGALDIPETSFRLVERIPISAAGWTTTDTNHKDYTVTDTGAESSTYEAYSGLAETATDSLVSWGIACAADNYMFVGDCYHPTLPDASYIVFRSVAGRFDVYDFQSATPAILRLPNIPTAMAYFLGQLLIFDQANIYRVNPSSLSIENVISGYGCQSQQSLVVTQYGVFFADLNGIHLYDGRQIKTISEPIYEFVENITYNIGSGNTTVPDYSYKTLAAAFSASNRPKLAYFGKNKMLLFACSLSSVTVLYGYNIQNATFTQFTVPDSSAATLFSFITGKDGEIYIAYRASTTNYLYKFMSVPGTRKAFVWVSAKLSFNEGDEQQYQKIYKAYRTSSANAGLYYGIDNGTVDTPSDLGDIASAHRLCKSFRFVLATITTNQYVNNVTVIFRRLVGKR